MDHFFTHLNPASPQFGARSAKTPTREKPIVYSTDLDETLVNWNTTTTAGFDELALMRQVRMIQAYSPKMAVHLNTGRGLTSIKHAATMAAPFFAKLPVDYLSLNNGLDLYINKTGQRADRWIMSLTPRHKDRDTSWDKRMATDSGWHPGRVIQTLEEIFKQNGFQEIEDAGLQATHYKGVRLFTKQLPANAGQAPRTLLINWFGDQPSFSFSEILDNAETPARKRGYNTHCLKAFRSVIQHVKDALKTHAMDARMTWREMGEGSNRHFALFTVHPKTVTKASPLQHLLMKHQSQTRAVITAGDHEYNDAPMLKKKTYTNNAGRRIPNYPVVSGNRHGIRKALNTHPRVETAPLAEVETALETQVRKILNVQA